MIAKQKILRDADRDHNITMKTASNLGFVKCNLKNAIAKNYMSCRAITKKKCLPLQQQLPPQVMSPAMRFADVLEFDKNPTINTF